jgi:drug/metabolite transporter (DMT)-like permease
MNYKRLLETFTLACLWGPSFLLIKLAIEDVGPFTLVALRVGIGGLILLLFFMIKFRKEIFSQNFQNAENPLSSFWNKKLFSHSFILGFFSNGLPFICISYSLFHIPTSLSALINGVVPIITILLANLFLRDEKLNLNRVIGVLLGFAGFLIIFLPPLLSDQIAFEPVAILLGLLASFSYAGGMIYARKFVKNTKPLVVPILQLFTSLVYLIPIAWLLEWPENVVLDSYRTWACIFGLAVLGTSFAYILYYRIVNIYGAISLSMTTYLLPIIGTTLGVIFLEETITMRFWLASALILGGVLVVNQPQRKKHLTVATT